VLFQQPFNPNLGNTLEYHPVEVDGFLSYIQKELRERKRSGNQRRKTRAKNHLGWQLGEAEAKLLLKTRRQQKKTS
jgi:hypothetical protein